MAYIIMGLDPGVSGAIAFYDCLTKSIVAHDTPVVAGKLIAIL